MTVPELYKPPRFSDPKRALTKRRHSAEKGCLSGICRGRKTQNQYSSRLCRESTCFHGIAVPPYWFHSYIFEIVTIVVYWFCGRENAASRQSNLGGAVLCHNALGGPSHDSQLARKKRQILHRAHAYDRLLHKIIPQPLSKVHGVHSTDIACPAIRPERKKGPLPRKQRSSHYSAIFLIF